jgi:hypothetical protein
MSSEAQKKTSREYKQTHPMEIAATKRKYYETRREKVAEYYQLNKEVYKARAKRKYDENPEANIKKTANWMKNHPEQVRELRKKYYYSHLEEIKERAKLKREAIKAAKPPTIRKLRRPKPLTKGIVEVLAGDQEWIEDMVKTNMVIIDPAYETRLESVRHLINRHR